MSVLKLSRLIYLCLLFGSSARTLCAAQLSHERYVALTKNNTGRCVNSIATAECHDEITYAVAQGMISKHTGAWAKKAGYFPVFRKRGTAIGGVCQCGCFAEGTRILTSAGWVPVETITKQSEIVALGQSADLRRPDYDVRSLRSVVSGPETAALYVFSTEDDHQISVTQHHAMILAGGLMKAAKDVVVGDLFVTEEGKSTPVVRIAREFTPRDVWNVEVKTNLKKEHVILANGILVGDLAWQNQLREDLARISLRK